MKQFTLLLSILLLQLAGAAQVSISTDGSPADANTMLHIKSTSKGVKFPRMSSAQRKAIAVTADDAGLMVFDTDRQVLFMFNGDEWMPFAYATSQSILRSKLPVGSSLNARIGSSCAISGNFAVVGADNDSVGSNANQGAAYVFEKVNGAWVEKARLVASDGTQNAYFGRSVAIDGDNILVGAMQAKVGAIHQGAAYVFVRSGNNWTEQAKIFANDGATGDEFGHAVAIQGDLALVGVPRHKVGSNAGQGAVYVLTRSGTSWTHLTQLKANDGAASDYFGHAIELRGNGLIVGAPKDDIGTNEDQGSAYVFTKSGNIFTLQGKLLQTGGPADAHFGDAVSIDNDVAAVSSPGAGISSTPTGWVTHFRRTGTTWEQSGYLYPPFGGVDIDFGYKVVIRGEYVLLSAVSENLDNMISRGAAYLYRVGPNLNYMARKYVDPNGTHQSYFGYSIAFDGTDFLIGSTGANKTQYTTNARGSIFFGKVE